MKKWTNNEYQEECERLIHSIGEKRMNKIFSYKECEFALDYLGFLQNYKDIAECIPKDFVIIDIGCYLAVQAEYFKNHAKYIGIDPNVDVEYCLEQDNSYYINTTVQEFCKNLLPDLQSKGLNLNKTFAICSAVPDEEARKLVAKTFNYYRVEYSGFMIDKTPSSEEYEKIRH